MAITMICKYTTY